MQASARQSPQNLRVDYHSEALGIDNPKPKFSWEVGDRNRGALQSAYQILISSSKEKLAQNEGDVWDSKKVKSNQSIQIDYTGRPLRSATRYFWKVQTWDANGVASGFSKTAWFEMGLLSPEDWKAAWISEPRATPTRDEDFYENIPSPLFRKQFTTNKEIRSARLYISGLGYYEAFVNGEKVGDHLLDPGWTQYAKSVYYSAYDISDQISKGENAIGVMLGNGWYNPLPMKVFGRWNLREILTIGQPKVIGQLKIDYEDGTTEWIYTDESWKTAEGPVVKNNVYLGEWYDARMEKEGWTQAAYNDKAWKKVVVAEAPAGKLTWQYIPPIRHTTTLHARRIHSPKTGVYVADLAQNFAGVIRFKVRAPKGTEIVFRYAELLYPDGTLDFRTTAATQIKEGGIKGGPGAPATAWQEDRYICKGGGEEIFQPRFTFHGFRYIEISGLDYKPSLQDVEGLRLNADLTKNASFSCSNEMLNRLQEVTEWTLLSNVFSIQSDCPAREKFGYGGDIVTAGEVYLYNYDMANFYIKTARDFAYDALPNGGMTECAPNIGINAQGLTPGTGPVGWTLAHPFVLEQLYKYYGNMDIVKEQYEPLKKLVDFYREHVPDHIIRVGISDHASLDERPIPVTSTAFYYHHVRILVDMAELLGKTQDASKYATLAENIKKAFIEEFVNTKTGKVFTHTQAAQVFALYYDLLPEESRKKALEVLKDEILIRHKGHFSTGIFATKFMLNFLSDQGMDELNYTMVNQKDFPGFGYMINNGATTLWENWVFKTGDSKNHPMFGSVSEWFYKSVLGIQQSKTSVAFSDIVIKPSMVGDLQWAKGHYQSVRGNIASSWWKYGSDVYLSVELPANTKGLIYVPVRRGAAAEVYEGNNLIHKNGTQQEASKEISFLRIEGNYYVFEVGSGIYDFVVRY